MAPTVKPTGPKIPAQPRYYTTVGQANNALAGVGNDEPGYGVRFAKGKGYYLGPAAKASTPSLAAAAAGGAVDPYSALLPGPMTPQQIQQYVTRSVAGYPAPLTTAQIQAQASGEISPLVKAVTDAITGQTKTASDAISGYTHSLQAGLANTNFAAPYQQAEQGQAAVDAALQQSLNGTGQADVADLGKRLGMINDPAVAAAQQAVSQNATANAGTQVAQGSNALSDLIANAAAASSYGQKLGGVAGLYGTQQLAQNAANGQAQIASQTQQLESQVPSIIQALTSESDSNATNKAQAANSLFTNLLSASDQNATNRAQLAEDWAKNQGAMAGNIALAEGKDAAQVQAAAIKAEQAAAAAVAKASAPSPSLSRANGYLTDNSGNPITDKNGNLRPIAGYKVTPDGTGVVSTKPTGANAKTLTPEQINTLIQQWHDGKATTTRVKAPKPDANGNPVYQTRTIRTGQLSYPQAVKRLTQLNGGDRQAALQILDTVYKRGEAGRAWLTNREQQTLSQAGLPAKTFQYKSLHFLNARQAHAIQQATGGLPQGQWIQEAKTGTKDLGPIYVLDEAF